MKLTKKQIILITSFSFLNLIYAMIMCILKIKGIIKFDYYVGNALFGAICLFLGWVIPNHFDFSYRKKNAYYKGALPEDIKKKKFAYRVPCFILGFICFLICFIFFYI